MTRGTPTEAAIVSSLKIVHLTAFQDGKTIFLEGIDRPGHIIETKDQNGVFTGFIDKGVHVFDIETDFLDTVEHRGQAAGAVRHLDGDYIGLADGKSLCLEGPFRLLHFVDD